MALDFGKLNFSVSFNPTSAFPLDARSYFESYADAEAAAKTAVAAGSSDSVYYFGQLLVVVENGLATFYVIQPNRTLQELTSGSSSGGQITIDSSLFEYTDSGALTLKGFDGAQAGQYFALDEDGNIAWITPDVYTKTETDEQISKAVAAADHLKRKVVADLDEAKTYMENNDDADQYIFMVPTGLQEADDKYDEYVVIEVAGTPVLEKVGSWEVDLSDYATVEELEGKVDKEEGSRLITQEEIEKLASLEDNVVKSVESTQFGLDENGHLTLEADVEDINGLQDALDKKVDVKDGYTLLSPSDKEKLDKLDFSETGDLEISGTVNAANVKGLGDWITENGSQYISGLTANNLSSDLVDKINFITSVNTQLFSVTNGKLDLAPVDGSRLITQDEGTLLELLAGGQYDNYIRSVDNNVFSVTNGKLNLVAVPNSALMTSVGDMTQLITYEENTDTTLVNEINNLYEMLRWQDIVEQ